MITVIVLLLISFGVMWILHTSDYEDERGYLDDMLPVYKTEGDFILSKQGDMTVAFEITLPEIFTQSEKEYKQGHDLWVKAIKLLPKHTVLHKQDRYIRDHINIPQEEKGSYLERSADRHFNRRKFFKHTSYLLITKKAVGRKPSTSAFNNLLRKNMVPVEMNDDKALREFMGSVGQLQHLLTESGLFTLRRLSTDELIGTAKNTGVLESYLLQEDGDKPVIKDIRFKPDFHIGENYVQLFSLSDPEDLPPFTGSFSKFDKFSTDKTTFPLGFSAPLGLLLDCNHVYNQFIVIDDAQQTIKKLETKRTRLQSLSAYSRENAIARDAASDFLNEAISKGRLPVKAHFNVMLWTDKADELKELRNKVSAAIAKMNGQPRQETIGAAQLFWAALPGNEADLPQNETFDTFAEQAACFLSMETNYRSTSKESGIRFCDRLTSKPVYVDFYDAPRQKGTTSNMGTLICGTSGGGKSMTANHILHTLYQKGAHIVVVDIGGSYRGLCELVGGYYYTYKEDDPIRVNPFYLSPGEILDTEKKENLKALLITLWKQESENFNRSEYVGISNALQLYYNKARKDPSVFLCFDSFYEFCDSEYRETLKLSKVKEKDFDIDSFLYVLKPFYHGGEFDYLLNAKDKLDILHQRFVVFELDNIKDNPIIFPVLTLAITELFISKIRKLPGIRKVLAIDEAWKAIAKAGMAEFIKYAYKTIRKFDGIPIVITQEIDDLISSPVIKDAIINLSDVKILMDMRKFMNKFDKLQETLGLSEKAKTILLSVNKDNREFFVDLGGQEAQVLRNELCKEEYYAFTTEGKERVKVLEYASRFGSMEKGIEQLIIDNG